MSSKQFEGCIHIQEESRLTERATRVYNSESNTETYACAACGKILKITQL